MTTDEKWLRWSIECETVEEKKELEILVNDLKFIVGERRAYDSIIKLLKKCLEKK